MKSIQPIGILDSGIGGLSITTEIIKLLPKESIVYFGDSKNAPYSRRSDKNIKDLSEQIVKFLLKNEAKLIVLACNTLSVSTLEDLRKKFEVPIIGVVPAIKTASNLSKNKKIAIFSTKKTSTSKYQKDLIKNFAKGVDVLSIGSDKIVPLIENGKKKILKKVLKSELYQVNDSEVDVIVLGCTHFPLVKKEIGQIVGKNILIIDSGSAVAKQVKNVLEEYQLLSNYSNPSYNFYTSGELGQLKNTLKRLNLNGSVKKYG